MILVWVYKSDRTETMKPTRHYFCWQQLCTNRNAYQLRQSNSYWTIIGHPLLFPCAICKNRKAEDRTICHVKKLHWRKKSRKISASNPVLAKLPSSFTCLIVFWCSSCRMALHGGYVRVLQTSSEFIFMRFLAVSGKPKIKEISQWLSIHLSCNQILITPTHSTKLIPGFQ